MSRKPAARITKDATKRGRRKLTETEKAERAAQREREREQERENERQMWRQAGLGAVVEADELECKRLADCVRELNSRIINLNARGIETTLEFEKGFTSHGWHQLVKVVRAARTIIKVEEEPRV